MAVVVILLNEDEATDVGQLVKNLVRRPRRPDHTLAQHPRGHVRGEAVAAREHETMARVWPIVPPEELHGAP